MQFFASFQVNRTQSHEDADSARYNLQQKTFSIIKNSSYSINNCTLRCEVFFGKDGSVGTVNLFLDQSSDELILTQISYPNIATKPWTFNVTISDNEISRLYELQWSAELSEFIVLPVNNVFFEFSRDVGFFRLVGNASLYLLNKLDNSTIILDLPPFIKLTEHPDIESLVIHRIEAGLEKI